MDFINHEDGFPAISGMPSNARLNLPPCELQSILCLLKDLSHVCGSRAAD